MITTADIAKVTHDILRKAPVEKIIHFGNFPEGEVVDERVTIHVKDITHSRIWSRAFVEVNIIIPDISDNTANLLRIEELEDIYSAVLAHNTGTLHGIHYRLHRESTSVLSDRQLRVHFINNRLLFEYLNTTEQWQQFPQ